MNFWGIEPDIIPDSRACQSFLFSHAFAGLGGEILSAKWFRLVLMNAGNATL